MKLSREKIQRMVGGNVGGSYVGGSGGSGGGGGVGAAWVDENYVSKEFFNQLFAAKCTEAVYTSDDDGETWTLESSTSINLLPNEMPSEVIEDGETAGTKIKTVRSFTDIKALKGLWTDQYLSALGQNSSGGGGGGGASTLADLNDVALSNLQGGDVLKYDGTLHKWVNGASTLAGLNDVSLNNPTNGQILQYNGTHWVNAAAPNTGVTSVAAGTGLTTDQTGGAAITGTGTISLSSATQTDIVKGVTAYGWGNHANAGYASASSLNNYLLKAGGTITGQIYGSIAGQWVAGRDHALLKQMGGTTAGWAPVVSMLTANGSWEMGTISDNTNDDYLILSYITNTDYANSNNRAAILYFPKVATGSSGTLALTSDISNAVSSAASTLKTWVGQNYLGISATAAAATKLATARYIWGQSFDGQADITGNMSYVGNITTSANSEYSLNGFISMELYGKTSGNFTHGGFIDFHYNGSSSDYTSRIIEDALGRVAFECSAGIRIGGAVLKWDSTNNALKLHSQTGENDAVNFYATGGVSALGQDSSGGGGGDVIGGNVASFQMPYTGTETSTRYWHKLGTYVMNGDASVLAIDVYSGNGYNGNADQNSWARIMIKKSNTRSGTSGSVGVTCEQFGPDIANGKILVAVKATTYNTGEVWVKCPWKYPNGSYTVQGNFGSWSHNNSISSDTTNDPHNQNPVGYFNNTSTISYS